MEQLTRGDVEFIYGIPITIGQLCKVKKVGVYPMNGVRHIHNKSGFTTPKNSKICKIYLPKVLIMVINQRVYRRIPTPT